MIPASNRIQLLTSRPISRGKVTLRRNSETTTTRLTLRSGTKLKRIDLGGAAAVCSRLRCKVSDACAPRVLVAQRRAFACNERCRAALDMLARATSTRAAPHHAIARLNKERSRMRVSIWSLIRNMFGSKIQLRKRRCGGDDTEMWR